MRKDNTKATPFDTIESAHAFLNLLTTTLGDTKREVEADVERESTSVPNRRADALRVAVYNLERLEYHLTRSARLLNDLRSLRRMLFDERGAKIATPALKSTTNTSAVPKNGHPVAAA
jgi:hypothetical protein